MKIELLETVKHEAQVYEGGEIRNVPDGVGQYFCDMGWAKDVDGAYASGERDINKRYTVQPDKVFHGHQSSED